MSGSPDTGNRAENKTEVPHSAPSEPASCIILLLLLLSPPPQIPPGCKTRVRFCSSRQLSKQFQLLLILGSQTVPGRKSFQDSDLQPAYCSRCLSFPLGLSSFPVPMNDLSLCSPHPKTPSPPLPSPKPELHSDDHNRPCRHRGLPRSLHQGQDLETHLHLVTATRGGGLLSCPFYRKGTDAKPHS